MREGGGLRGLRSDFQNSSTSLTSSATERILGAMRGIAPARGALESERAERRKVVLNIVVLFCCAKVARP